MPNSLLDPDKALACGAVATLESALKMRTFKSLEVGVRHPFRYKLQVVQDALARITESGPAAAGATS